MAQYQFHPLLENFLFSQLQASRFNNYIWMTDVLSYPSSFIIRLLPDITRVQILSARAVHSLVT